MGGNWKPVRTAEQRMVHSCECTQVSPNFGPFFNLQAPWVLAGVQQPPPVSTITSPEPV